jgi:hypothetical protein
VDKYEGETLAARAKREVVRPSGESRRIREASARMRFTFAWLDRRTGIRLLVEVVIGAPGKVFYRNEECKLINPKVKRNRLQKLPKVMTQKSCELGWDLNLTDQIAPPDQTSLKPMKSYT